MLDRIRREALARSMSARLGRLAEAGRDELDVIDAFMLRLEIGFDRYGPLDLRRDQRDWRSEADEEIGDYAVYRALQRVGRRFARVDSIDAGLTELAGFDTSDTGGES